MGIFGPSKGGILLKRQKGNIALLITGGVFSVVLLIIVYYLIQIQIVDRQVYQDQLTKIGQQVRTVDAPRGEILLSDGTAIVKNVTTKNIRFDAVKMPKETRNNTILKLSQLLSTYDDAWEDTVPISYEEPFVFLEDTGDGKIDAKIEKLKSNLELQPFATVDDVMNKMIETFDIPDQYTAQQKRIIAGVQYEMLNAGFSDKVFYTFAQDVSTETATNISEGGEIDYPGVDVIDAASREYTDGTLMPHLLGRVTPLYKEDYETILEEGLTADDIGLKGYTYDDVIGQGGIEGAFEEELRGTRGTSTIQKDDTTGEVLDSTDTAPIPGNSVQTTIVPELQKVAQESLLKNILYCQSGAYSGKAINANAGAAIVIEVDTGNILAMAQYPSYDINDYSSHFSELSTNAEKPLLNRSLNGLYAVGSTFKPVIGTAGLSEGVITPESVVYCNRTYTYYSDYQPKCLSAHGNRTVKTALQVSCNIFFYDTGRLLGIDRIDQYSKAFGFGESTGIEIPESTGYRATPERAEELGVTWNPGDVLQASIGQSYNQFTPLQMANYAATLARDGQRLETHLVKNILSYDGTEVITATEPVVVDQVTNNNGAFATVKEGMILASGTGGTSLTSWSGFPYSVASKTGTPQLGQEETHVNSTYIAFTPVEDPDIAIFVLIENGWHGYTGSPVARDIANAYYFGDYDVNN